MDMNVNMDATADLIRQLAEARAANDMLKARLDKANTRRLSMKVGEKQNLSVYGLGRFPVTLYRGQWERLLSAKEDILQFIEDHSAELSIKE